MTLLSRQNVLKAVGFTLALFASLLGTIGLSTDHWADVIAEHKTQNFTGNLNYGLVHIQNCRHDILAANRCSYRKLSSISGLEMDYLNGCLAAMCLAFIANVIATFAMGPWIAKIGPARVQTFVHILSMVMLWMAAFWMCIAVAVFTVKDEDALLREPGMDDPGVSVDHKFGYSWGLSLFAIFVDIAAAVALLMAKPKD